MKNRTRPIRSIAGRLSITLGLLLLVVFVVPLLVVAVAVIAAVALLFVAVVSVPVAVASVIRCMYGPPRGPWAKIAEAVASAVSQLREVAAGVDAAALANGAADPVAASPASNGAAGKPVG